MRKIPTVFKRNPNDMKHVLPEVTPGCEWVLDGEGVPTRKYDGTCVMKDSMGEWWARREVKPGKTAPPNFLAADFDEATGKTVGWEPMSQSAWAKWHAAAVDAADGGPFEQGTYELCGPKVNGNPEGLDDHRLIPHAEAETIAHFEAWAKPPLAIDYVLLEATLQALGKRGYEGIVWHHPDGRMAKLKARDFPQEARNAA